MVGETPPCACQGAGWCDDRRLVTELRALGSVATPLLFTLGAALAYYFIPDNG